ncbi:hypothetical protein BC826DRAFT_1100598 [Russula brevipes]|nr:hypothetical protein BC826DRAFT_1100598 [Russula brevipes]
MSNPIPDNPPPVPPKQAASSRRHQQQTHHSTTRSNTRTDPPHAHAHHSSRSADATTRTRPSRSQTSAFPNHEHHVSSSGYAAETFPSSDSTPSDKSKPHRSKTKKGSIHADVIDRLDFTGVGPMFHHDGPFDACAPSRNRQRTKAPMYAWTSINAEDEEVAARYREKEGGPNPIAPALSYNPSYPSELPRSPPAAANYSSYYSEPPKKKVDAIAEAWGMHEPEPYEEFFAGGGDADGPVNNGSSMKEARSNGGRTRGDAVRARGSNRIPPPQPIFVPDAGVEAVEVPSPQPSPVLGGNVSRNKSLMQRIRRMRDSPNVPVGFDDTTSAPSDGVPSPTSSTESGSHGRSAHRRANLLLGRFTRGGRGDTSPTAPEPYVYVDDRAKELPPAPTSPADDYFDSPRSPGSGMSRKTSILKRVGRAVRGGK